MSKKDETMLEELEIAVDDLEIELSDPEIDLLEEIGDILYAGENISNKQRFMLETMHQKYCDEY